jgi:hypothetical protein
VGRLDQRGLTDVHRDEAAQRSGRAQRVQQQPGLVGSTRAELNERAGVGGGGDLVRHRGQDGPLGARRVVLIQLGDLLEQLTAVLVIQPLGGQRLG